MDTGSSEEGMVFTITCRGTTWNIRVRAVGPFSALLTAYVGTGKRKSYKNDHVLRYKPARCRWCSSNCSLLEPSVGYADGVNVLWINDEAQLRFGEDCEQARSARKLLWFSNNAVLHCANARPSSRPARTEVPPRRGFWRKPRWASEAHPLNVGWRAEGDTSILRSCADACSAWSRGNDFSARQS